MATAFPGGPAAPSAGQPPADTARRPATLSPTLSPTLPATLPPMRLAMPLAIALVVAIGLAGRLTSGWTAPLWFDETFTAVIASQNSVSDLVGWCRNEVGAPFYYLVIWAWAQMFGTSDAALRLPSLLASVATPALVLWRGHPDRRVRAIWAAILALYGPGFDFASSARCYALLMLAGTAASIAYLRLLDRPGVGRALAWTSLSVLGVLTHYHYAVVAGIQGLFFVALAPRAAVRALPALAPLAPMAAWMAVHYPLLQRYSTQGSWYRTLHPLDALLGFAHVFDFLLAGILVPAVAAWWLVRRLKGERVLDPVPARDAALGWSGLLALLLVVAIGLWTPSLTWRYAAAYIPAIALGGAAFLAAAARRRPLLAVAAVALLAANGASVAVRAAVDQGTGLRYRFNLDYPSAWLATMRPRTGEPRRVAFLWDNPAGSMGDPVRMAEVAGYFLHRRGAPDARLSILNAGRPAHPWAQVARTARENRADALIWIADTAVPRTRAPTNMALMRRLGWTCREFGDARAISVLACRAG